MPIDVTCPGCRTRFKVNDKFAGQKGPCPKCKTLIQIPGTDEDVVVHAPEQFGPKNAAGVAVLKPVSREEAKLSAPMLVGVISAALVVVIAAFVLRGLEEKPGWLLGLGAFLLAPPLVWCGYAFLRDEELEPHRGRYLAIRILTCSLIYALLWGAYIYLPRVFYIDQLELFHLLFVVPPILVAGAFAAFASLDLDFGTGLLHYCFYLFVTVTLCFIMGLDLLQLAGPPAG